MAEHRVRRVLVLSLVLGMAVLLPGWVAAATHYPTGSLCYDCHAVSKTKMVLNTHLIKLSQKAVDLGVTGGQPVPCLFCHEPNASSAPFNVARERVDGGYKMAPVLDHFDASSLSKHPVALGSSTDDPVGLDCIDCHTANVTVTVVSDGAGNARIHTVDAATQDLPIYTTLIGTPASAAQVSANTCQASACHDVDGGGAGDYTAPKGHAFTAATINDGAGATSCTQCHGSHNSYKVESLIILKTDGSTSKLATEPVANLVTPEKCGECHAQDDGTAYTAQGHGKAGITLTCTNCHSSTVAHAFNDLVFPTGSPSANPLRYALVEDTTAQSVIRQQAPYNQVYSICLTCHSQFATTGSHVGHDSLFTGCNDCHEPHARGVGANVMMVRNEIPKVNASGVPVYGDGTGSAPYEPITYTATTDAYRADGAGVCDSAECHQGQLAKDDTTPIWPLSSLMSGDNHSEGDQTPGADCLSCHTHGDSAGSWGAADSCTACHGTSAANIYPDSGPENGGNVAPNRAGKHAAHVARIAAVNTLSAVTADTCAWCHPNGRHSGDEGGATPEPSELHDGTASHFQDIAGTADTGDSVTVGTSCNNVNCHYNNTVTIADWYGTPTVDCGYCHQYETNYDAAPPNELPNAHSTHVDEVADGGYNMTCATCHDSGGYVDNHQDGVVNLSISGLPREADADAAYSQGNSVSVKYDGAGTYTTCNNVYCHGDFDD
ncbi:MAG: hypothetical protein P1P84_08885, partial [Deferrisomatales bacterium]|nr:hypothetical protein [Deferrisomatales bacterium]